MFFYNSPFPADPEVLISEGKHEQERQEANEDQVIPENIGKPEPQFLPGRITAFLYRYQARPLKIILMALVFITALYTKSYVGEYQMLINNHIGGIFYVLFGSLAFSAILPGRRIFASILMATTATCILEFIQWFRFPFMEELTRIKIFAYLFGNSFNPADFIYYGMGSVLALLVLWLIREN